MRRYTITVNNTQKVVDVESLSADTFNVQIDGRSVEVRLDDHRDLMREAVTPELMVRPAAATRSVAEAPAPAPAAGGSAPAAPPAAAKAPARAAAPAAPAASGGSGRDKLNAPMPGVILSIDTAVGASVKRGDTLMILEAMKMKNEMKAPVDGVVAEIYVAAGDSVKYNQTLVRFEA